MSDQQQPVDGEAKAKLWVNIGPSRPGLSKRARGRLLLLMSVGLLTAVVVGALLAAEHSSTKPTVRTIPAADRNASASLLRAAAAVDFKPTSEPGGGGVEAKPLPTPQPASAASALPPGTTAPAFDLRTPTGQHVSLASLRGKTVLLELFATWCPHCAAEAPHLKKLYAGLPRDRYAFVSINADGEDAASILAFHIWFELPYPALLDPNASDPGTFHHAGSPGPVSKAYRIKLFPTFYVIDPRGRVAWAAEGEQPDALLLHELHSAT